MTIRKSRIRSVDANFGFLAQGAALVLAVRVEDLAPEQVELVGFDQENLEVGTAVLPPAALGPVSRRNAEGHEVINKDQPKETAYRQKPWTWHEWHGPYERVEKSKIVDVPYERYPRSFVPPQGVELTVSEDGQGRLLLSTPKMHHTPQSPEELLHVANLLLEAFGFFEVLTADLGSVSKAPVRRLNWEVLPTGEHPWARLKKRLEPILKDRPEESQVVIEHRLKAIEAKGPAFVAVGRAGFRGYLIFGFPEKELFVLESTLRDNATYVLEENWEEISTLSKAEILSDALHHSRIIHRGGWHGRVDVLLASDAAGA